MKTIQVGLIGFGYIGKVHTIAYRNIPLCINRPAATADLTAVLRSQLETEKAAMQAAGFGLCTDSADEFYAQPLELVDICTPNYLHLEQSRRALEARLAVYCEKPLANSFEEAQIMADLADKAGVINQVAFVMRYLPAVRQMKTLVEAGEIGEVLNFRGHMFHGSYLDPNRPMSWRLRRSESGGGVLADLGSHLIDLASYLLGGVKAIRAQTRTFISQRFTAKGSPQREMVDVDDWALCTLELVNGACGVIEVTRMAAGASAESGFEIYGSRGAVIYKEGNPDSVSYYSLQKGEWIQAPGNLPAPAGERPIEQTWPTSKLSQGMLTNAHLACQLDLLLNIAENKPSSNNFRNAVRVQQVIEAAYQSRRQRRRSLQVSVDHLATHHRQAYIASIVQGGQVGVFAHTEAAQAAGKTHCPRWHEGSHLDRFCQGNTHKLIQVAHALVHGGCAAGNCPVRQGGAPVLHSDRLPNESINPIRQPCASHGIGDRNNTVAAQAADQYLHHRRVAVDSICDELGGDMV
jgi:predicted dehydrogenase